MQIRGWLTGLIIFLLVPSLLFASLWFYNKFESVRAIDKRLAGLDLIQIVGPLVKERAITGKLSKVPDTLNLSVMTFGSESEAQALQKQLDVFLVEGDVTKSLRSARDLTVSISQQAQLSSSGTMEATKLASLLDQTLLTVVIETTKMAENAKFLMGKDKINVWDKMLIPVQGGQFKVAADTASRETLQYFENLDGPGADELRKQADLYRKANVKFQGQGSKLLTSTIKGDTGADINGMPVIEEHPEIVLATFRLWQSSVDYFKVNLQRLRTQTIFEVTLAGLVGGFVIIAAFGIAVALSRALAERTMNEFERLGYHDPLTGLPNRRALLATINGFTRSSGKQSSGLVVFDLKQFKKINDLFGDKAGDEILRAVAKVLADVADPADFISRTGGSEFVVLRPNVQSQKRFADFADKILKTLHNDLQVDGQGTAVDANGGIYIHQTNSTLTDNALIDASLALRSAKLKGPGYCEIFHPEMRDSFVESNEISKDLLTALSDGKIKPWFQPQVDIETGQIVGLEALVRWVDGDDVRFPGAFLPAAEDAGYMEFIDQSVRDQVLQFAVKLHNRTERCVHFGLNVSAGFLSNNGAAEQLHKMILDAGLKPASFSLEILEAVMIDDTAATPITENIARLSELGFYIELDDFGTGRSSISSLRDLKVDRVKIDRSFVSGVDRDPELQKFTSALIQLAKSLDIAVLAEGVETEAERLWLKTQGCDVVQGFLVSKAVPEGEIMEMIARQDLLLDQEPTSAVQAIGAA